MEANPPTAKLHPGEYLTRWYPGESRLPPALLEPGVRLVWESVWGSAALLRPPPVGMLWWGLTLALLGPGAVTTVVSPQAGELEAAWRC